MSESIDPIIIKEIINLVATSELSSYQIAYKYKINKKKIDLIAKEHLGAEIYEKKEKLAFTKLYMQLKDAKEKGLSVIQISNKFQVAKSTVYNLLEAQDCSSNAAVQVISVEHPEENLKPQSEDNKPLRVLPVNVPERKYVKAEPSFNRRNNYHEKRCDYAKLNINGVQILFDPKQENVSVTIAKILTALQE